MAIAETVECSVCNGTGEQKNKLDPEGAPLACKKCGGRGFFEMKNAKVPPDVAIVPRAEPELMDAPEDAGAYAPPAVSEVLPTLIVLYSTGVQFIKSPGVASGTLLAINPLDGKTRVIS